MNAEYSRLHPHGEKTTWKNDFVNHDPADLRMDDSLSVSRHLPIASGAIESALHRVINLRIKSNATCLNRAMLA